MKKKNYCRRGFFAEIQKQEPFGITNDLFSSDDVDMSSETRVNIILNFSLQLPVYANPSLTEVREWVIINQSALRAFVVEGTRGIPRNGAKTGLSKFHGFVER